MKSILKTAIAAVALVFLAHSPVSAEEMKYTGTLSGIDCSGCKKDIAQSLAKIKGVKTIRIIKTGEEKHRLEVITDGSVPITRKDADKALSKSDHYKIHSWAKSES